MSKLFILRTTDGPRESSSWSELMQYVDDEDGSGVEELLMLDFEDEDRGTVTILDWQKELEEFREERRGFEAQHRTPLGPTHRGNL